MVGLPYVNFCNYWLQPSINAVRQSKELTVFIHMNVLAADDFVAVFEY